jgi:hypothetical protein
VYADDELIRFALDEIKGSNRSVALSVYVWDWPEDITEKLAAWEEKTRDIRAQMAAIEVPKRRAIEKDYFDKYPIEIQAAWNKPESERTAFERQMVWKAKQYLDPKSHEYIGSTETVAGGLKGDQKKRWQDLKKQLDEFADFIRARCRWAAA